MSENVDSEVDRFIEWTDNKINNYLPIESKQMSQNKLDMPWVDLETSTFIKEKHKLFLKVKNNQIPYQVFNSYCKLLKILIHKLKKVYYNNKFNENKNDCRKQWQTINSITGRGKKSKINEIETEPGIFSRAKKVIATSFNKFFTTIALLTQLRLGPPVENYENNIPLNPNTIILYESTSQEVFKIIKSLKNSNSLNDIPVKILKKVGYDLSPFISHLFNMCIGQGVYPTRLKSALVTPIFKKGDHSDMNNFRPISVLPVLNKIFEKMLHHRLNKFLRSSNILSDNQFGFTKGKDTQKAALKLIHEIMPSLGSKKISACLFLDFSKAFDSVPHDLLLRKLERYGIRGNALQLFTSYLENRSQCVTIDGVISEVLPVTAGVPQGSVLGPLLFITFANDINNLFEDIKKIIFADDTSLICSDENPQILIDKLHNSMSNVYDWCNYNKLALNCEKTKLMIFTNRKIDIPPLIVNGAEIELVTSFKYLGFWIDNKLKHNVHLKKLT
jgi:hypothetical protein